MIERLGGINLTSCELFWPQYYCSLSYQSPFWLLFVPWECYKDRSIVEERKKQKPMFTCGFSKVKTSRTCSRLNLADFGRSGKVMLRAVKFTFEAWQRRTPVDFFKVHYWAFLVLEVDR